MNNRNLVIIGAVVVAILLIIGMKDILQTAETSPAKDRINLRSEYDQFNLQSQDSLSILVFSYDSDCCEETRLFYDEYNNKAKALMAMYQNQVPGLFIDTALVMGSDRDLLNKMAVNYQVFSLPTIVIRDQTGTAILVKEGMFAEKEIQELIDGNL